MRYQATTAIKFKTPAGIREVFPGQVVLLQPEKAIRLVESGKVIPISRPDPRHPILEARHLFETTVDDLVRTCPGDLPSYLREHHPELWGDIMDAQEVVNDYWLELHEEKDVFPSFKAAVDLFKAKMLHGAGLYGGDNG